MARRKRERPEFEMTKPHHAVVEFPKAVPTKFLEANIEHPRPPKTKRQRPLPVERR